MRISDWSSDVCSSDLGLLAIADTVRPGAADTLRALRATGIEHLVMLTGDNQATAEAIARDVGIYEVHSELLPADKVAAIQYLFEQYRSFVMFGDRVYYAPAIALSCFCFSICSPVFYSAISLSFFLLLISLLF